MFAASMPSLYSNNHSFGCDADCCAPRKTIELTADVMARAQLSCSPSSELGEGDFAVDYNARTGRPIRKMRAQADSPFVDSAMGISDVETEDEDYVSTPVSRKRKRSQSPPLPMCPDNYAQLAPSDDECRPPVTKQINLKNLTFTIPEGHQGPISLQFDPVTGCLTAVPPPNYMPQQMTIPRSYPVSSKRVRMNESVTSAPKPKPAGFLDLPAELRNEVYRLAFVQKDRLNFANPKNFSRSSALLRTCKQVHQEGREILYGENEFYFARRNARYGSLWQDDWSETGFRAVRQFVKSAGPTNLSLIRHLTLQFDDATPCLNPSNMTHEQRRFVHDDVLMSVLRHLGDYAQLERLDMNFHGRRQVQKNDGRFLDLIRRIKADHVRFVPYPIGLETAYAMESKQEDSVGKMLLSTMTRKQMLYD